MASARSFGRRLGGRLRAYRKALGWSQARLAEKAGVTPNYVGVIERGEKLPTLDTLARMAAALQTSLVALLDDPRARDGWLDEVRAVAQAIPEARRALTLAVLRAIAAPASGR